MHKESRIRDPLIDGNKTFHDITVEVAYPVEGKANKYWWTLFGLSVILMLWGFGCIAYTIGTGIGVWGLNKTINWAWDITNFVWWIGIGHAGTLISAVLLLFRQKWRMAINRSAEAMTIFGVIQAGLFPLIHMGRPWLAYWVFPIPNQYGSLWVNFNSPLLWDVFAISTYLTVSTVFWYIGLIPDFAMIRDRVNEKINPSEEEIIFFAIFWMVRKGQALAEIRRGVTCTSGISYSSGFFSSFNCLYGLCYLCYPWLAYNNFPSLLCIGSTFLWICNG